MVIRKNENELCSLEDMVKDQDGTQEGNVGSVGPKDLVGRMRSISLGCLMDLILFPLAHP